MVQVKKETVTREVVSHVEEEVVTLVLNLEQARTLAAALRHIGGPPTQDDGTPTVRGILTDQIGVALSDTLGIMRLGGSVHDPDNPGHEYRGMFIPKTMHVEDYVRAWGRY